MTKPIGLFTTKEVLKGVGCKYSFLLDVTRSKGKKKPFYIPTIPGKGQGSRTYYSFEDLVKLGIIFWASKMGFPRFAIGKLLIQAEELQQKGVGFNPLSILYNNENAFKDDFLLTVKSNSDGKCMGHYCIAVSNLNRKIKDNLKLQEPVA